VRPDRLARNVITDDVEHDVPAVHDRWLGDRVAQPTATGWHDTA
jgi:hypothetical protein